MSLAGARARLSMSLAGARARLSMAPAGVEGPAIEGQLEQSLHDVDHDE